MLDMLAERGPDGRGVQALHEGSVMLGHRRLAVIGTGPEGAQPIANEDGTVWLTFNGEIYNYRSLRDELIRCGHRFATNTDSEVIVHAYEEWDTNCVSRFRGIFAFAIWDSRTKSLFLARDPLGVKPLYYARHADRFVFASQPKAIVADPGFRREIDPQGMRDFLAFGHVPLSRSAFSGISKLAAGHTARLNAEGRLTLNRYWTLDYHPARTNPDEALEALGAGIVDAVHSQLVADVPVGCFLSGGIDSSLLVAIAQPALPSLRTFTIGFDDPASDERRFAGLVAGHFGTDHHERIAGSDRLAQQLCNLQEYFDEPFDPNGPLPFMEVARLARECDTVVALGGDGADELFAGYLRYDDFDRPAWLPNGRPAAFWRYLRRNGILGPRRSAPGDLARFFRYEACLDASGMNALLGRNLLADGHESPESILKQYHHPGLPAVSAAQYIDMHIYLTDHVLCKVDRASMAYGVEARVPFLDPDLVQLAFSIPLQLHYRRGERKALMKQVAKKFLPSEIVTPRKKGFSSPMHQWFNARIDGWLKQLIGDGMLVNCGILHAEWAGRLGELRMRNPAVGARAGWLILTAELWARRWIADERLTLPEAFGHV